MFNFYTLKASPFFWSFMLTMSSFSLSLFIIGSSLFTFFKLVFSNLEFSTFQARTNHIIIHSMILFFLNTYFGVLFRFITISGFSHGSGKDFSLGFELFQEISKRISCLWHSFYEKTWFTYRI